MTNNLENLLLSFAVLLSLSDETSAEGCKKFCAQIDKLMMEAQALHYKNVANKKTKEMLRSKRLIESIMGFRELALDHRDKLEYKEWENREMAADDYERKLYEEPLD
jgi:hypothetical protein